MDIFDQIATGVRPPPPPSTRTSKAQPTLREIHLAYAIAKKVPDMARGFTVHTNYGDIAIAGQLAKRVQALVRNALLKDLSRLERRRK